MAVHASHMALPFPVKGARFSVLLPYLDADGDPTDPVTPDTEITKDGAAAADCTEEVSAISGTGLALMTFTGDETNCSGFGVHAKVASGPKATLGTFYPRVLPVLESGTAQSGSTSTTIKLAATGNTHSRIGCIVKTTGGTGGGGGSGSLNNQARIITAYNAGTYVATVEPAWETTPDNTTTYDILAGEGSAIGVLAAFFNTVMPVTVTSDSPFDGLWDAIAARVTAQEASDKLGGFLGAGGDDLQAYLKAMALDAGSVPAELSIGGYDNATDSLMAIRDRGDAAWTTGSTLDAAGVRTAVGLASANLDTQLDALPTAAEIATAVWAAGGRTLTSFGTLVADIWSGITATAMNKIADHVRRRTQANVEASANGDALSLRSEYGDIQSRQEGNTTDNAGQLTVYRTDGTTELGRLDLATDAAADPVTGTEVA